MGKEGRRKGRKGGRKRGRKGMSSLYFWLKHTYIYIKHIHIYIHTYTHICVYTYIHTHVNIHIYTHTWGLDNKESACHAGDSGLIPRSGRSSGEGNVNLLPKGWWVGESGCLPPINRPGVERKISFISDASNCPSPPPPQATNGASAFIYRRRKLPAETALILIVVGTVNLQFLVSQVALVVKNLPANAGDIGDAGLIPGSGRSPGGEHGNSCQYSCLVNCMDRVAWQAIVHGVANSWTLLRN